MKPSERIVVIAGQIGVSDYSSATAAEAIARKAQLCCDSIIAYLDEKYLAEGRLKKCNIEKAYPEAYRIARRFHELYEEYAPQFGYKTREETKEFDPESPNGRLMAKVCHDVVQEEIDRMLEKNIFKPV